MKLTQTSPTTFISQSNGLPSIVAGVLLGTVGIIGIPTAIVAKTDPFVVIFAGIFLVIGVVVIVTAKKQTITLTNPGASTIVSTRLLGGKTNTTSFDASQVAGVQVTSRIDQTGADARPSNPVRRTMLDLYLTDGTRVQLANERANRNSFLLNGIGMNMNLPLTGEGQQIATLFNVQLLINDKSFGDDPVQSVADAAQLVRQAMNAAKNGTPYEQPVDVSPFSRPQPTPSAPPVVQPQPLPQPQQQRTPNTFDDNSPTRTSGF